MGRSAGGYRAADGSCWARNGSSASGANYLLRMTTSEMKPTPTASQGRWCRSSSFCTGPERETGQPPASLRPRQQLQSRSPFPWALVACGLYAHPPALVTSDGRHSRKRNSLRRGLARCASHDAKWAAEPSRPPSAFCHFCSQPNFIRRAPNKLVTVDSSSRPRPLPLRLRRRCPRPVTSAAAQPRTCGPPAGTATAALDIFHGFLEKSSHFRIK